MCFCCRKLLLWSTGKWDFTSSQLACWSELIFSKYEISGSIEKHYLAFYVWVFNFSRFFWQNIFYLKPVTSVILQQDDISNNSVLLYLSTYLYVPLNILNSLRSEVFIIGRLHCLWNVSICIYWVDWVRQACTTSALSSIYSSHPTAIYTLSADADNGT